MVVIQLLSDYRHDSIGVIIHGQEEWRNECNTVVLDFTANQCNVSTGLQTSSVMYLFENTIHTTEDIFNRYSWSHLSCSRMSDVPSLYLSAAARIQSWVIENPTWVSGKALSNSNDTRTLSIASQRRTRIADACEPKFTLFLEDITKLVSRGHVFEVFTILALAGALPLRSSDAPFLTTPPGRVVTGAEPEVLTGLWKDGLYRIIISWGEK